MLSAGGISSYNRAYPRPTNRPCLLLQNRDYSRDTLCTYLTEYVLYSESKIN